MTTRTYTQKNGTIWEWEETPELHQWITTETARKAVINYKEALDDLSRT